MDSTMIAQGNPHGNTQNAIHQRRSANYKPNLWDYDFLQSLHNKHKEGDIIRVKKLMEDVKHSFAEAEGLRTKLELTDSIKKLGLSILFEKEIDESLDAVMTLMEEEEDDVCNNSAIDGELDLYTTSLAFRLLRQHGHQVSQDKFRRLLNEVDGGFAITGDTKGVVELLEASHLALEQEPELFNAKALCIHFLNEKLSSMSGHNEASAHVIQHSVDLSHHWRVQWLDVKWQIKAYENLKAVHDNEDNSLVQLAKLHFNTVQATHQEDLRELLRWWRDLGLVDSLSFSRDRLVECFLCALGLAHAPRYSSFRKCLTKVIVFVLVIDDVYDLYGSFEELQHFTAAVDRWDFAEAQQLPKCMKVLFQALDDVTNDIAYEIAKEKGGVEALHHLRKLWADFCKGLFVEAKWDNKGYTPSLEEYMSNSWVTSSGPLILSHAYFILFATHEAGSDHHVEDLLNKHSDVIYNSSVVIRLCNDLATSPAEKARGDAPSSILCYMREVNVSEEAAEEHIKDMIVDAWKNINGNLVTGSSFLHSLVDMCANAARVAHMLYHNGDGFGDQDQDIRRQILSSLVKPLSLD